MDLYCKRFRSLSKKKENIRVQRNKIYAHNDTMRIMNEETIYQQNPITYPDIQELIDFALDCIGLILGILTGICPATEYSNIDDWEGTLKDYIHFYCAVRSILFKLTKGDAPDISQMNARVRTMLEGAIQSDGIEELFETGKHISVDIFS